jgi:hypothetical protein
MSGKTDLAQRAYHAYGQTTEHKNYQGLPMPEFHELTTKITEAWENASEAVYLEAVKDLSGFADRLSFSGALQLLKLGRRMCRAGWNGKGMFLFLVRDWTYTDGKQDNFPNQPFLAMKTADDKVIPWLASQADLLAEDWEMAK